MPPLGSSHMLREQSTRNAIRSPRSVMPKKLTCDTPSPSPPEPLPPPRPVPKPLPPKLARLETALVATGLISVFTGGSEIALRLEAVRRGVDVGGPLFFCCLGTLTLYSSL